VARALIGLDLDGTVLGHGLFLPDAPRFLERLRAAGHVLAVNTDRLPAGFALEAARRIEPLGLHLFSDGTLMADAMGRIRARRPLASEAARAVQALLAEDGVAAELHTALGVRYHLPDRQPERQAEHVAGTGTPSFPIALERVGELPLVSVWLLDLSERARAQLEARLAPYGRLEVYGPREDRWILGLKPADRHKGTGLLELAWRYGIPPERTVMLGDGLNDLGGLERAGLGIAVGNAPDFVQEAADEVVAPSSEGGLCEAAELILERFGRA